MNRKWLVMAGLGVGLAAVVWIYAREIHGNKTSDGPKDVDATALVESVHAAMARHDWDAIYANADEQYRQVLTQDESAGMFERVVETLGEPMTCEPGKTAAAHSVLGDTIRSECETTFSHNVTGHETFYWRKSGGEYRLSGYNASSAGLVRK